MADYKFIDSKNSGVERYSDGAVIPNDPDNPYWKTYQEYVTGGGLTDPYRTDDEWKVANSQTAKTAQGQSLRELAEHDNRIKHNLPPEMSADDITAREEHAQLMQGDIDNPSADHAYNPPLPPGVTPPDYDSITIHVERIEGWQGNLGWKATITAGEENFPPANLAMAWYNAENCEGYVATSGAFILEDGKYVATCPAGHEPGDVDIFFGLLYASAKLSCFTMLQGVNNMIVNAYEAE